MKVFLIITRGKLLQRACISQSVPAQSQGSTPESVISPSVPGDAGSLGGVGERKGTFAASGPRLLLSVTPSCPRASRPFLNPPQLAGKGGGGVSILLEMAFTASTSVLSARPWSYGPSDCREGWKCSLKLRRRENKSSLDYLASYHTDLAGFITLIQFVF